MVSFSLVDTFFLRSVWSFFRIWVCILDVFGIDTIRKLLNLHISTLTAHQSLVEINRISEMNGHTVSTVYLTLWLLCVWGPPQESVACLITWQMFNKRIFKCAPCFSFEWQLMGKHTRDIGTWRQRRCLWGKRDKAIVLLCVTHTHTHTRTHFPPPLLFCSR